MSDPVFVVQEPSLDWVAMCTDTRCGVYPHLLAETSVKARADAAATRHRRLLKTMPTVPEVRLRPDTCDTCGQSASSAHTIAELRDLITIVEARLAKYEASP